MKLRLLLAAFFIFIPIFFAHADSGLTNCFDYYKFGSVEVDAFANNKKILSGSNIAFNGYIRNTNPYPIVDGSVYVKIFKKDTGLVDQFFAKENIYLNSSSSVPISFSWDVPAKALSGEYYAATYFVSQNRFNLSGLSFTPDITGSTISFTVLGKENGGVYLDKNTVKVDNKNYTFAAFTPKVPKEEPIKVDFDIKNDSKEERNIDLTYNIYSWDGLRKENIVDNKKEKVTLKSGEFKRLSYEVKDNSHPVYYVVIEAKSQNAKSILDIRFAREGIEEARINFPGIKNYPIKKGVENTIFSCVHNSGLGESIKDGKVVMTLTDTKGKVIDTYSYTGDIFANMMGIKRDFIPDKDYKNINLTTEIYVADKLVDTINTKYSCNSINKNECGIEDEDDASTQTNTTLLYIVVGFALLVVVVSVLAYHGHLKRKDVGTVVVLFFTTFAAGLYNSYALNAKAVLQNGISSDASIQLPLTLPANSVQGQYQYNYINNNDALRLEAREELGYNGNGVAAKDVAVTNGLQRKLGKTEVQVDEGSLGFLSIDNFNFQYTYGAEMLDENGNTIPQDGNVEIGKKIKFVPANFDNNQIAWFLTGSTYDTPYAYWSNGVVPNCKDVDKFGEQQLRESLGKYKHITGYFPIVVTKPLVVIDTSGSTAGLQKNSDGTYTVTSPGSIKANVIFRPTTASGYFQYTLQETTPVNDIHGTRVIGYNIKPNTSPSACTTFKKFDFPLEEKVISFSAKVEDTPNNPPNTPSISVQGNCMNDTVRTTITDANPADPDGDAVTYQYQIDDRGFGILQNTSSKIFTTSFNNTGIKQIRVRSVDPRGLVSGWVTKSFPINNCDASLTISCSQPTLQTGDKPQWTANATSGAGGHSFTWDWPSRGAVTSGPGNNTYTSINGMGANQTWSGPTVTVTNAIGATASIVCPDSSTGTSGGGGVNSGFVGECKFSKIESDYTPTWIANALQGGSSPYTYVWSGVAGSQDDNTYTATNPIPLGGVINGLYVNIKDSNGKETGNILCGEAKRDLKGPSLSLFVSDSTGRSGSSVKVSQGKAVSAFSASSGVNSCVATGGPGGRWNDQNTFPFSSYGSSVGNLSGYPLDTSTIGRFNISVKCKKISNQIEFMTASALYEVVGPSKFEEF